MSAGIDDPLTEALDLAAKRPADPPGAFSGTGNWLDSMSGLLPQHGAAIAQCQSGHSLKPVCHPVW